MRFADVRLVIGTRPEAIKLAPVARALAALGAGPRLVLTGQHPDLDPADYGLDGFDAAYLRCRGHDDPRGFARAVATRLADQLLDQPALLIVQGDTSSAFGGALASAALGVPLAHVEAGLRTHDPLLPWPEEEFRVAIDASADLLFAPTELSAANLLAEDVCGEIHITGNTGVDAVLTEARNLPASIGGPPRLLVTCHRRENWGEGLQAIAAALVELTPLAAIDVVLHPNPIVAATMRAHLAGIDGIDLRPPCSHRDLLALMRTATLILSDSGGIQEEAAAMGAPLLVLRAKTERPEAITTGNMILVGTDPSTIVAETRRLLGDAVALAAMRRPAFPYGDGRSGPRIAEIIVDWLGQKKGGAVPSGTTPLSVVRP